MAGSGGVDPRPQSPAGEPLTMANPIGTPREPLWLLFAPVIFLLLWSGGYSASKIGMESTGAFLLLVMRYVVVLIVLVPAFLILRPRLPTSSSQWRHLIVVGILIQGLYFGLANFAIELGVSAALLGILLALQPILVALLAPRFTNERVGSAAWIGLLLGIAGAAIAILAKSRIGDASYAGIIMTLIALVSITIATLYEKRYGTDQHLVVANMLQCSVGLLVALPFVFALEEFRVDWNSRFLLALLYSALCNSIVATTLLFAMIRHGAASRASALLFLVPPTSAAIAWYMFGEEMPAAVWLGMALAGVGVTMVRRA